MPQDGAPPGNYAVNALWPTYEMKASEEIEGPDRFKGKYNDVQNPPAKVLVSEGGTSIPPLDLKTK